MSKAVGRRVRPWTQGPMVRRRREKVTIVLPTVDTYRQQMEEVQRLYERLRLTEPRGPQTMRTSGSNDLTSPHRLRMIRSHTFAADSSASPPLASSPMRYHWELSNGYGHTQEPHYPELMMPSVDLSNGHEHRHDSHQQKPSIIENDHLDQIQTVSGRVPPLISPHPSRPVAYSYPLSSDQSENVRYVGRKFGWMNSSPEAKDEPVKRKARAEDESSSSGVSSDEDSENKEKNHVQLTDSYRNDQNRESLRRESMDILQLCEHLRTQGLGEPILSIHSHTGRHASSLPPGVKARCLPRDPSTREKIKGRARLDYELANLRAVAFCEQQHPRAFRTASADLRDRDVRLLEEEERENVHRNLNATGGNPDDENDRVEDEDDDSSLVGSPLSREELFLRIEAWADDVNKAFNRG